VNFVGALIKYGLEKAAGESGSRLLYTAITDLLGEYSIEKIASFFDQGEGARKILEVFKEADDCFRKEINDDHLIQAIGSKPFAGLPRLEKLAKSIPDTLDDQTLLDGIRQQFKDDWGTLLSDEQVDRAAEIYRSCLDNLLAVKLNQLLQTLYRKVNRIEEDTHSIRGDTAQILENQQQILKSLNRGFGEGPFNNLASFSDLLQGFQVSDIQIPASDFPPQLTRPFIVPKSTLDELKAESAPTWIAIVDGPSKGKTQIATYIASLSSGNIKWISLRNKSTDYVRHFRNQIALWYVQLTNDYSVWTSFLVGSIPLENLAQLICRKIEPGSLLIVDDLPDPVDEEAIYGDLAIAASVLLSYQVNIITTGQRPIPPIIKDNLAYSLKEIACPRFTEVDVASLLEQAGAVEEFLQEKTITWITVITRGYPGLIMATIIWLKQRNWQYSAEVIDGLITGEPLKETLDFNRRFLVRSLSDLQKEMLFRISIAGEPIDKNIALEISRIEPSIQHPGEIIDHLTGPWIECSSNDEYRVIPLLENCGKDNLEFSIQQEVHRILVRHLLPDNVVKASKASAILNHLWLAKDYQRFADILLLLLLSVQTKEEANYFDWAASILVDVTWPSELNLNKKIMIRTGQIKLLSLADKNFRKHLIDLDRLISIADQAENRPTLLFSYVSLGQINNGLPVEITIPRAAKALLILKGNFELIMNELGVDEDFLRNLYDGFWFQGLRVSTVEQLNLFLSEVERIVSGGDNYLLSSKFVAEISVHLFDRCWLSELEKQEEERNWEGVIAYLRKTEKLPIVTSYPVLQIAIGRAKAVIYAEHKNCKTEAIKILEGLPTPEDPDLAFFLNYYKGSLFSDAGRPEDAISHFLLANNTPGEGFEFYRLDNMRKLTIELERIKDWNAAKETCIETIHRFDASDGESLFRWDRHEMLGELAFIHWSLGDYQKCFAAMYGYVMVLYAERSSQEEKRYREAFNKAGHGLGWFLSVAMNGEPPEKNISGEDYGPVIPGLFGIRKESLGEFVSPVGVSQAVLLLQLSSLASYVFLHRIALKLCRLAVKQFENEKRDSSIIMSSLYTRLAFYEAVFGEADQALMFTLRAAELSAAIYMLSRKGDNRSSSITLPIVDIKKEITANDCRSSEKYILHEVFAPMFIYLFNELGGTEKLLEQLDSWVDILKAKGDALHYQEQWIELMGIFSAMAIGETEGHSLSFDTYKEERIFKIIELLIKSVNKDLDLKKAINYQINATLAVVDYGSLAWEMLFAIGRLVHSFWLTIARTRRFAFYSPQILIDKLASISPSMGGLTITSVFWAVSFGLRVNIPTSIHSKLNEASRMSTNIPKL